MNNEPVAWIDKNTGKPRMEGFIQADHDIPLYTHPAKELDEQFKKGFEAGKEEGWKAHKFHHPAELTDEEILKMAADMFHYSEYRLVIKFARAILRKAQEK